MILEPGFQILVAHRRLFENDHSRLFVGVVDAYHDGIALVTGRTWLKDGYSGEYLCKPDFRTKVVAIASGTVIVYRLPSSVDLATFRIEADGQDVVGCDDGGFRMDLNEGAPQPDGRKAQRRPA